MKKKKEESPYAAMVADLFKNVRSKEEFNQIMAQLMKEGLETVPNHPHIILKFIVSTII